MKKLLLVLGAFALFSSHDMFLKLDGYLLPPHSPATIQLFNGTFDRSENVIDRDRMIDVSLVGNGQRMRVDTSQWSEKDSTTFLHFETGEAGTWLAGVSTRARNIELAAADFNSYLEHDGVVDVLEWRRENDALDQDAVEKYSKHVKTIFQVGDQLSDDWQTVLGYPIEFVPLANPYDLHPGHVLPVQLLRDGQPLADQLVYVGIGNAEHAHEHAHDHAAGEEHHHHAAQQLRTDAEGKVNVVIDHEGIWYLRTIHLVPSTEAGLTHESNWATLTFEIGQGHSHTHTHAGDQEHGQEHEHGSAVPSYVYWVGSLILFLGLFFWFNRKRA